MSGPLELAFFGFRWGFFWRISYLKKWDTSNVARSRHFQPLKSAWFLVLRDSSSIHDAFSSLLPIVVIYYTFTIHCIGIRFTYPADTFISNQTQSIYLCLLMLIKFFHHILKALHIVFW